MSIKLKGEWLDKIKPPLIDAIREIKVRNGMFLDRKVVISLIAADVQIPKMSPVRRQLENLVDEFPLSEFVSETIGKELYDRDKYSSEIEESFLTEIDGYEDPEFVADRLLEEFQSLPWEYLLAFKLPDNIVKFYPKADFQISEDIWLRRGSNTLETEAPLENLPESVSRRVKGRGLLSLMAGSGPKWENDALYLQLRIKGFIPPYGDSQPYRDAISRIKSFLGLLVAVRAVQLKPRSFVTSPKEALYIHRMFADGYRAENRMELDDRFSSLLHRMEVFDNGGAVTDEKIKTQGFMNELEKISRVFHSNSASSVNLILAGQWVFDSHIDPDPLLTYIRSMVVLEILVGSQKDARELSIGDLIRNRCAYLIGKDFEQRDEIMSDLKRIYAIRSQIVHRGKAQLTLEERTLLRRLQWMGQRVIQEEIARIPKPKS